MVRDLTSHDARPHRDVAQVRHYECPDCGILVGPLVDRVRLRREERPQRGLKIDDEFVGPIDAREWSVERGLIGHLQKDSAPSPL